MNLSQLLDLIRWDWRVNRGLSLDRLRALTLLTEVRLEQYIYRQLGERRDVLRAVWYLCRFLGSAYQWFLCHSNIPGTVTIGRGLRLPHPQGIIIAGHAHIGDFCTIYQDVTIAWNGFVPTAPSRPQIGDQVLIGCGAIVIGDIRVGSFVLIGAGATVSHSVPDYSRVTSPQPLVVPRHPSEGAAKPGSERHLTDPYSIWR